MTYSYYFITCFSIFTQSLLKDIISHVLSSRHGYRVSSTTKVKQYVGLDVPLVYLPPIDIDDSTG